MLNSSEDNVPENDWYQSWFEHPAYLELYGHRDDTEAAEIVQTIIRLLQVDAPNESIAHGINNFRVLDSACGSGRHSKHLSEAFQFVVGLDLSSFLLQQAQKNSSKTHFVRGNLKHLPFADGSFSLITSLFTSFGYFCDDNENKGLLRQWATILDKGGTLILDLPNPVYLRKTLVPESAKETSFFHFEEKRWIDEMKKRVMKEINIRSVNDLSKNIRFTESVRLYELEEIQELLKESGFKVDTGVMGNYLGTEFVQNNSDRMLFSARKV